MSTVIRPLRSLFLAAALTAAAAAAAEPVGEPGAESEIRVRLEAWTEAFNAGEAEAVCDLFAPDLIATYRGQPERGYAALCDLLQSSLQDAGRAYRYELELQEIIAEGDLAAVRLVWHLTVSDSEGRELARGAEPGLDVFRRQPDGRWRIIRYLAYGED